MTKSQPVSEPLGNRRQTGDPAGWKYDRKMKPTEISTAQIPQEPLGDQQRGKRA
jgi:hypothetical protein